MAKGDAPFDAAKAKEVLRVYADAADRLHNYFQENSNTGGGTAAAPEIWEDPSFRKRFHDFGADIETAATRTETKESFTTAFQAVINNCDGCHDAVGPP
jgi:cytochrome c556